MKELITSFFKKPVIEIDIDGDDFKFHLAAPPMFQFVLFVVSIKVVIFLIPLIP